MINLNIRVQPGLHELNENMRPESFICCTDRIGYILKTRPRFSKSQINYKINQLNSKGKIPICLVLVCYRNYRYPGCTTRTSVPSQPTALQKPSYKKEPYLQNKNHPTTAAQPNPTQHQHHQHHPSYKNNRPTKKSLRKLVKSNRIKNKESKIKK